MAADLYAAIQQLTGQLQHLHLLEHWLEDIDYSLDQEEEHRLSWTIEELLNIGACADNDGDSGTGTPQDNGRDEHAQIVQATGDVQQEDCRRDHGVDCTGAQERTRNQSLSDTTKSSHGPMQAKAISPSSSDMNDTMQASDNVDDTTNDTRMSSTQNSAWDNTMDNACDVVVKPKNSECVGKDQMKNAVGATAMDSTNNNPDGQCKLRCTVKK